MIVFLAPSILAAFVSGSIPMGILFAKLFKLPDPRDPASENLGAVKTVRISGLKLEALVFFADFLKGFIPSLIASLYLNQNPWALAMIAVACVVGHCYSVFLSFSGGRGVATSLGVLMVLSPPAAAAGIFFWILAFIVNRTPSVSAVLALTSIVTAMVQLGCDWTLVASSIACATLVIRSHQSSWQNLLEKTDKI